MTPFRMTARLLWHFLDVSQVHSPKGVTSTDTPCNSGGPKQNFCRNTESRNSLFSKAEPKPKPNIRPKHIIRPKQISSAKIDYFGQKFLFSHAILDYHKWLKQLLLAETCSFGQIICFGRITETEDCRNTENLINFGRIYSAETEPKQYSVDH